jgi:Tol biopolymer transport system component
MKKYLIAILVLLSLMSCSKEWQYLAQDKPGERPEIFAPGVISGRGRMHCYPTISHNGKQILWMTLPPKIMEVHYSKGIWSDPAPYEPLNDIVALRPNFGPNGDLYFSSSQIQDGLGSQDIWRLNSNGDVINIGSPVNTKYIETAQSFRNNGDIYYTSYVQDKRWDRGIVMSKYENGAYQTPQLLPENINIPDPKTIDYLPYIAPDGSFLLFCSNRHDPENESCRIYISFKDEDGTWRNPLNLSYFLNFDQDSRDPALSADGKYLFFSSGENIYWVRSTVIDKIKTLQP